MRRGSRVEALDEHLLINWVNVFSVRLPALLFVCLLVCLFVCLFVSLFVCRTPGDLLAQCLL